MSFKAVSGSSPANAAAAVASTNVDFKSGGSGSGSGSGVAVAAASTVSAAAAPLTAAADRALLSVKWRGLPNKGRTYVSRLIFEKYENVTANVPEDVSSNELRALIITAGQKKTALVALAVNALVEFSIQVRYHIFLPHPSRGISAEFDFRIDSLKKPEHFEANQTYIMEVGFTSEKPNEVGVSGQIVKMAPIAGDEKKAAAGNGIRSYMHSVYVAYQGIIHDEVVRSMGMKMNQFAERVMKQVDVSTVKRNAQYPDATEVLRKHFKTIDPKLLDAVSMKAVLILREHDSDPQMVGDIGKLYFDMMTHEGIKKVMVTFLEGMLSGQRPKAIDDIFSEMGAQFAQICFNECQEAKVLVLQVQGAGASAAAGSGAAKDPKVVDSGSAASGSGSGAGAAVTSNSAAAHLGASAAGSGAAKDSKVVDSGSTAGSTVGAQAK